MPDRVDEFLKKYGGGATATAPQGGSSRVDAFLAKYGGPFAGAKASSGLGWSGQPAASLQFAGAQPGAQEPELGTTPSLEDAMATPTVGDHFKAPERAYPPIPRGTVTLADELQARESQRANEAWREAFKPTFAEALLSQRRDQPDPVTATVQGLAGPYHEAMAEPDTTLGNAADVALGAGVGTAGGVGAAPFTAAQALLPESLQQLAKLPFDALHVGNVSAVELANRLRREHPAIWTASLGVPGIGQFLASAAALPKATVTGGDVVAPILGGALVHGGLRAGEAELAARRSLANPDAGLLAARNPNAYTAPVDPNLANFGALADAGYVRGEPVPGMGVRVKPGGMPAPGGALPAPETALARPVPSGHYGGPGVIQGPMRFAEGAPLPGSEPVIPRELPAPTGAVPQGLPDPMEFGRNPDVIVQPTITPAEAAQAAEVARLRGIPVPPGLFPSIEPPAPVAPPGPSFQEAQAARRSTPGPLPKEPEPVAPTATAPAAPPLAETVRIPHEAGTQGESTGEAAPLPPRFGAKPKPPAPPAPAPTTPVKPVEGVQTARFGAKGPPSAGTSVRPNTQVTLLPRESEGTVPFPEETRIRAQGGAAAEAGRTGRVVVTQADGLEAIVPPERAAEAQRLANEGKLAEIANGAGTSPKPAVPTAIVRAPGRDVLVDTPEKREAAVAANPGATVEPATPENMQRALAERTTPEDQFQTVDELPKGAPPAASEAPRAPKADEFSTVAEITKPPEAPVVADEAPASPPSTSGTSTGRVERLRQSYADVKPGEEFEPFRGAEGPEAATRDVSATARIVDEGGGKFAAEGAIGYGDEPMRLIGKGALDEAKAHVARWADEQLRELEGQDTGAPKPVEAEVADTKPAALPEPVEGEIAPPAPGMVRLYRGSKIGEVPHESAFFSDESGLKGVATPFSKLPGRELVYVDVPKAVADAGLLKGAVTDGEYQIPEEYRRQVRPFKKPAAPSEPDVPAAPPRTPDPSGGGAAVSGRFGAKRSPDGTFHGEHGELRMRLEDIQRDPKEFQYRPSDAKGITDKYRNVNTWDENTNPLTVWRDPADGKVKLVNGHQRYGIAERAGQPDVPVKFIKAATAAEAKHTGMWENLRDGQAKPEEAARIFKTDKLDTPQKIDAELTKRGISKNAPGVADGRALAALPDTLWNEYLQGEQASGKPEKFYIDVGNAIRDANLNPDQALELAKQLDEAGDKAKARDYPGIARRIKFASESTTSGGGAGGGLFGTEAEPPKNLYAMETELEHGLLADLGGDRGLKRIGDKAGEIESKGVGKIDAATAKQLAATSKAIHGLAEGLLKSNARNPLHDIISETARDVDAGKIASVEAAIPALRERVLEWLRKNPATRDDMAKAEGDTPLFRSDEGGKGPRFGAKKPFGRGESGSVGDVPPGGEPPPLGEMAKRTGKAIVGGYRKAGEALDFLDQRILGRGVTAATKGGWALAEKIPGVGRLFKGVKAVGEAITKPEGEHLGIDWADRRERYTRDARLIQHDGAMLVRDFRKALKGTTPAEREAINSYMRSESEALPDGLSEKARRAIDDASNYINILRDQEVELGTLSPEARTEYARYILRQFASKKPGIFGRRGGIASTDRYDLARDAYGVRVKMSLAEVNELLGDTETTYKKQFGSEANPETVVKFGRDEVAAAEREAFVDEVRQKYAGARARLSEDATREMTAAEAQLRRMREERGKIPTASEARELTKDKAHREALAKERDRLLKPTIEDVKVDVGQAKMLHKAQLDVPRLHDVVVEKFDPMTPEMEAQLKRVVEPGENLAATIMRSSNRIASARFLKRLAEDMDVAKTPDGRQIVVDPTLDEATGRRSVPAGYTILGDEKWGPLQGKGVLTDHVEDLRGVLSIRDADGLGARLYDVLRMFNSGWKLTHTVLSPRTIFRQYPSNLEFLNDGGLHWAAPDFPLKVKRAMEIMADPRNPLHREAVANDLLGSTVLAKEELGVGTKFTPGQRIARAVGSGGLSELPDSVLAKASERYAHPDNVSKMTMYAHYRLDLGMSEEAAVREVRKWMPDPRNVSKAVRVFSDMPFISPFARFGVQSKTIAARTWRERPIRAFTTALQKNIIRATIVALVAKLLGKKDVTPEQEDQLVGERGPLEMPLWQDEKGNAVSTDYRFLSTTGDVYPRVGKIGESGLDKYFFDFTGMAEAPVIDLVRTAIEQTDRYGRPLTHDRSATGKALAAVEAYFRQVHPTWSPATGYHADAIKAAFEGKPAYEGAPVQTPAQAIVSAVFGINMRPQEARLELVKLAKQFSSAVGHAKTDLITEPIEKGETPDSAAFGGRVKDIAEEFQKRAGRFGARKTPVESGK